LKGCQVNTTTRTWISWRARLRCALFFLALGVAPSEAQSAAPPARAIDVFGDALPAGAVARLGTTRLRPSSRVHALAFNPDGREILAIEETGVFTRWSTETGRISGEDDSAPRRPVAFSPPEDRDRPFEVHQLLLVRHGVYNLENLDLEEVARDKVYEFAFVFAPLRLKGATGSPGNPIAVR
jgi:hypothetical protein